MSYSFTTNLGLSMANPGTGQAFVTADINANWSAIDVFAGATNTSIGTINSKITALQNGAGRGTLANFTASTPGALNAIVPTTYGDTAFLLGDGTSFRGAIFTAIYSGAVAVWQAAEVQFINGTTAPAAFVTYLALGTNTSISLLGATGVNQINGQLLSWNPGLSTWSAQVSGTIIPTAVNTGGTVAVNSVTGEVTGSGAITALRVNSTAAILQPFRYIEMILRWDGTTAGSWSLNSALGSSIDVTAASYFITYTLAIASGSPTTTASAATTTWAQTFTRNKWRMTIRFYNHADALGTTFDGSGMSTNGGASVLGNELVGEHTVATAWDGWNLNFAGAGTLSNLSVELVGHF